jgi:hypothetical protein
MTAALRRFFQAHDADKRGDREALDRARASLIRWANYIGPPFVPMLIGAAAMRAVPQTAPFAVLERFAASEIERLVPELRAPLHQFEGGHA